eukprot:CAMPEP_0171613766 /NCGR_PEP_ID=MMETSP0990-20121206/11952_1 /TAXON_ID=483369 /ORGANISM="non described non described, Strain CCMP2098" /LENGTH=87 /DNA_ID=CAMNT_0012177653 /DNA_START=213 /DNA_END=476 /DNA_ORIENTATION=-
MATQQTKSGDSVSWKQLGVLFNFLSTLLLRATLTPFASFRGLCDLSFFMLAQVRYHPPAVASKLLTAFANPFVMLHRVDDPLVTRLI